MKLVLPEFFAYIALTLFIVSALAFPFLLHIADWLNAREDRKKAEAEARAAEAAAKPA